MNITGNIKTNDVTDVYLSAGSWRMKDYVYYLGKHIKVKCLRKCL